MDVKRIGIAITELRKNCGYTQKSLADALGVTDKAVSKWERGLACPDVSLLPKLSILLNTDIESILSGVLICHSIPCVGVLVIENGAVNSGTCVYDKPLVYYLLSSFLLIGIKQILIISNKKNCNIVGEIIGCGEKLGVSLLCCDTYTGNNLSDIMNQYRSFFDRANALVTFDNLFLFGANLTRQLQSIIGCEGFAVFAKQNGEILPLIFCPNEQLKRFVNEEIRYESPSEFVDTVTGNCDFKIKDYNRGMLSFEVKDDNIVFELATFVRVYQETQGHKLADIEEISIKRGFVIKQ